MTGSTNRDLLNLYHEDVTEYVEARFFTHVVRQTEEDDVTPTGKYLCFFECEGHQIFNSEEEAKEYAHKMIERFKNL